jgi:hypothetical protein
MLVGGDRDKQGGVLAGGSQTGCWRHSVTDPGEGMQVPAPAIHSPVTTGSRSNFLKTVFITTGDGGKATA